MPILHNDSGSVHVEFHFCIARDLLQIKRLNVEVILFHFMINMDFLHIKHLIFNEFEFFPEIRISIGDSPQEFIEEEVQESQELLLSVMKIHFTDLNIH